MDCAEGLYGLPQGYRFCIVTDPPFNVGYHYNSYKDNRKEDEYYEWLSDILRDYPCAVVHYPESLYKLSSRMGRFPDRVVAWVYNSNTARQHRDIAFFDVQPDFSQVKMPYKNPTDKRIARRIAEGKGARMYDWMEIDQVKNVSKSPVHGTVHPCQMPLEVMRRIVGVLPYDMVIVDPFLGSGTTALAAIANGRHYIGFEIDADYFNIARERIWNEQSQKRLFDSI